MNTTLNMARHKHKRMRHQRRKDLRRRRNLKMPRIYRFIAFNRTDFDTSSQHLILRLIKSIKKDPNTTISII